MKIIKMPVNCDLSAASIQDAVMQLSASHCCHYIIQVHPSNIHWACQTLLSMNSDAVFRDTAPHYSIQMPPLGKPDAWAVWAYDDCVWSEGA